MLDSSEAAANGTHIYWPPVPFSLLAFAAQCAIYYHLNRSAARLIMKHLCIVKRAAVGWKQMVPQESPWAHRDLS